MGRRLRLILAAVLALGLLAGATPTLAGHSPTGANGKALEALQKADPWLVDTQPLKQFRPELSGRHVLTHSGPPITYAKMSDAQKGATWAAAIFQGWAKTAAEADRQAKAGEIRFVTAHELRCVGGMAGVMSPDMFVYIVEDRTSGKRACSIHEMESFFACSTGRPSTKSASGTGPSCRPSAGPSGPWAGSS
jgi:hypothetical protein